MDVETAVEFLESDITCPKCGRIVKVIDMNTQSGTCWQCYRKECRSLTEAAWVNRGQYIDKNCLLPGGE